MAEEEIEYLSYKKVIIFGVEGSGKSTLSKTLETGKFSEQTHTDESKYNFINYILSFFIHYFRCEFTSTLCSGSPIQRLEY